MGKNKVYKNKKVMNAKWSLICIKIALAIPQHSGTDKIIPSKALIICVFNI